VQENPAEGETATGRSVDERRSDEVAEEALLPHLLAAHVEAAECADGLAVAAAEGDELAVADEEGIGAAGGVEGRELVDFASVGVKVEGVVLMALVDGREIPGDRDGGSSGSPGAGDASGDESYCSTGFAGRVEAKEVDLNDGGFRSWFDGRGAEERSLRFGLGGSAFDSFDGEQIGIGREDDGGYAAIVGGEKWMLGKGLANGEVGEGSEGGEGVADAQEEVTVAEVP